MQALTKSQLRKQIRAVCPARDVIERESLALCSHVQEHPWWQRAAVVGAYVPLRREADVTPLFEAAWQAGKTLALPRVTGEGRMMLHRVTAMDDLMPGAYGILEPMDTLQEIVPERLEVLIVPLEGIDRQGMRLGKGGGYYDRLLPKLHCPTIGAVLSHQWVESVPAETWDRPLDAAADVHGIYILNQERND